jgi:pimeloyl-ACP methyl ester carboxylesterase
MNMSSGSVPIYSEEITAHNAVASLLVLHANGMCAEFYRPLAQQLASRGINVTLITLPGFDNNPPLTNPSWSALVEALIPIVREKLSPNGFLLGHSMGGMFALLTAAQLQSHVAGLVLMEPAIIPWRWLASVGSWLYRAREFKRDDVAPRYVFRNQGPGFRRVHDVGAFPKQAFECVERTVNNTDQHTLNQLAHGFSRLHPLPFDRIKTPVLTVRGASSGWSQRISQHWLSQRLPVVRAVVIAQAAHWLANEQDEAIAVAVTDFIMGIQRGESSEQQRRTKGTQSCK